MLLRGIMVAVDYSDILSLTLPYNRKHFSELMIVTSPDDINTLQLAVEHRCRTYVTNAFYEDGAVFNKWKALEQGLDCFGRQGWLCIMDADVFWPKECAWPELEVGKLYTPRRRMYAAIPKSPGEVPLEHDWSKFPLHRNEGEFAGYTQVFHAVDPVLGNPPWHQTNWTHAGGADSFFQRKWMVSNKVRPSFEVLHVGPNGTNWFGRAGAYADGTKHPLAEERFQKLRRAIGFRRFNRNADRYSHERIKTGG